MVHWFGGRGTHTSESSTSYWSQLQRETTQCTFKNGLNQSDRIRRDSSIALEKPIGEERRCTLGVVVVKCFRCGSENTDGAVSCRNCGVALLTVPGPRPEPIWTAGQRAILKAIGLIASFVVMVIGILLIGTSQRVGGYYPFFWDEAQLEW